MTTHRPATHVLIWRDPTGGANAGAGPMFGWQEYRRPDHGALFHCGMAAAAIYEIDLR